MNLYTLGTLGTGIEKESPSPPSRVGRIRMFCLCIHVQVFALRSKERKRNDDTCLAHLSLSLCGLNF